MSIWVGFIKGHLYGLVIRFSEIFLNQDELDQIEQWMRQKTGAVI